MLKHILTIAAFMVVTFTTQGLSHFVINADHFASIEFARSEPIMELGFLVMFIQGLIMSGALASWAGKDVGLRQSLIVAYSFGIFLVSYVVFTEPAKYEVPSMSNWIMVEGITGILQYGIFGVLMAAIHRKLK